MKPSPLLDSFREVGRSLKVLYRSVSPSRAAMCADCGKAPARWPCACEASWCDDCYSARLEAQA